MALKCLTCLVLILGCACAAPANEGLEKVAADSLQPDDKEDLKTASSSYWGGYPSGYSSYNSGGYGGGIGSVTGYGIVDDKYNSYYGGIGGYDNTYGYSGNPGYGGYSGGGYSGYNKGYGGYGGGGGYGLTGYSGNGGYGGYGGNGGLTSYYGYNNPYYQGTGNHLGYGYYNRKQYGNIYNSGITPNLVTGYRGYSRR